MTQADKQMEADKVVVRRESLVCISDPETPLAKQEDTILWLLIRYMRTGAVKTVKLSKKGALKWMEKNNFDPKDFSIPIGSNIRLWT